MYLFTLDCATDLLPCGLIIIHEIFFQFSFYSVQSPSAQPMKKVSKKRNNSGTFNVENPKKMKKVPKAVEVQEMPSKIPLKKKRNLDADNDDPSPKKTKFAPKTQKKFISNNKKYGPGAKRFQNKTPGNF